MTAHAAPSALFQRVADSFARQGMMQHLGAQLRRVEPGLVEIWLPYSDKVTQQQDGFHGGAMGAVADIAGGYAGLTIAAEGMEVVTAEYKINFLGSYQGFNQEGEAPGDPKPTNDRRTANAQGEWKYQYDTRSQVGAGLHYTQVRFPTNAVEDFNQIMLSASWLRSFETKGVPLVYLGAFITDDKAVKKLDDGITDKSKNLAGVRSYVQYALTPTLNVFNGLGFVYRKDKDPYARATEVEYGRDKFIEILLGVNWQFRKTCAVRTQYVYTKNNSNISIYDFDRNEVSTAVRCELN